MEPGRSVVDAESADFAVDRRQLVPARDEKRNERVAQMQLLLLVERGVGGFLSDKRSRQRVCAFERRTKRLVDK